MAKLKRKVHSVFAVGNWETSSGFHEVTVFYPSGAERTKKFRIWASANKYAKEQTVRLGLRSYVIDTPKNPHTQIRI